MADYVLILFGCGYPLSGAAIALFYLSFLLRGWLKWAGVIALAAVAWGIYFTLYGVYHFSAGFGPGLLLLCTPFPSAGLALAAFAANRTRCTQAFQGDRLRWRLYRLGLVLVPLAIFGPVAGSLAVTNACSTANHAIAAPVIAALDSYRRANGAYPPDLVSLVPDYLESLPSPTCFEPYRWFGGSRQEAAYNLEMCRTGETLLTLPDVTFVSVERYNFATGNWSSVSFLDGACSFLR